MFKRTLTLATLVLLLLLQAQAATTYYVLPTGSDSNSGTASNAGGAFLTLKKACDTVSAGSGGDTIYQGPGVFVQNSSYNQLLVPNVTLILNAATTNQGLGLFIGATNINVSGGFWDSINGNNRIGAAFALTTNAHTTYIHDTHVQNQTDVHGVWMLVLDNASPPPISRPEDSAHNCIFTNITFSNVFGGQCFFISGSNNLITRNTILNTHSGDCFIFHGASNLFSENLIIGGDNPPGGLHPDIMQTYGTDGNATAAFIPTYGNKFIRNQFWDWQAALAQITVDDPLTNPVTPLRVEGPLVFNNLYVRCGPANGSISSIDCPNTQFINNTFILCGTLPGSSGQILNFVRYATNILSPTWRGDSTNNIVFNNAFLGCGRNNSGGWYATELNGVSSNATDLFHDYNYVADWNGTVWGAKTGFVETHGLNPGVDPLMFNFPANNYGVTNMVTSTAVFKPVLNSGMINAGTNVAAYTVNDLDGFPTFYGSAYDIGAYEFDPNRILRFTFDEDFSSQLKDATGYAHNGVNFAGTNWMTQSTDARIGRSGVWQIVGTNGSGFLFSQYAAVTNVTSLDFITNGTISAWIQWGSNATFGVVGRGATIWDGGDPPSSAITPSLATNTWSICYGKTFSENDSPGDAQFATPTGPVFKNWGRDVTDDLNTPDNLILWQAFNGQQQPRDNVTWYHIAVTWIGKTNVIGYANGVPFVTNSIVDPWYRLNQSISPTWLCLGAASHGVSYNLGTYPNDRFFAGKLDDLNIFNRTLSATEVAALYNGSSATSGGGGGGGGGTTYTNVYVSPTGNDGNDGLTPSTPWTLNKGVSILAPDVTVNMLPGFYNQRISFSGITNGTAGHPWTLRSTVKWAAILGGTTGNLLDFPASPQPQYLVIDGLCITNSSTGDGLSTAGHDNTFKNLWVVRNNLQGINMSHSSNSNNVIDSCLVELNGWVADGVPTNQHFHGIYVAGPYHIIRNNVVRHNYSGYGIQYYTEDSIKQWETYIYNNLVYGQTNLECMTVWNAVEPGGANPGTNYLLNNTVDGGVSFAYGTDRITNCIIRPSRLNPSVPYTINGTRPATVTTDYNMSTAAYPSPGSHDVITNYMGFVSTNTGLYWEKSDSPARTKAQMISLAVDFFSRSNPTINDIGAFQFNVVLTTDVRTLDPSPANPDYWTLPNALGRRMTILLKRP